MIPIDESGIIAVYKISIKGLVVYDHLRKDTRYQTFLKNVFLLCDVLPYYHINFKYPSKINKLHFLNIYLNIYCWAFEVKSIKQNDWQHLL